MFLESEVIRRVDEFLDANAGETYGVFSLAQDWARVAKTAEEAGEAVAALIACTGQNPRKGVCGTRNDLLGELADVTMTGVLAIQHFTKDIDMTEKILHASIEKLRQRVPVGEE